MNLQHNLQTLFRVMILWYLVNLITVLYEIPEILVILQESLKIKFKALYHTVMNLPGLLILPRLLFDDLDRFRQPLKRVKQDKVQKFLVVLILLRQMTSVLNVVHQSHSAIRIFQQTKHVQLMYRYNITCT